jgi:predicted AAA+ superfamily ATPase
MSIIPPYQPRLVDPYLDELFRELPALMIVGPRAAGKTTTAERRAATKIRLSVESEAAAFEADPDAALRGLAEPVLLDEWQVVPGSLGAASRAINADPHPGRFLVTGSVRAELENEIWPATGRLVRVPLFPMSVSEQLGRLGGGTLFDRLEAGDALTVPPDTPDLRGYVELALRGGFPVPALVVDSDRARIAWHESYVDQLLTHDVEQIEESATRRRDPLRLRRYFEAYALNSAGVCDHKTIYDAAQINQVTAVAYEQLLTNLFVVDQIPAWTSNRLHRLVHRPKRFVVDAALLAALLRLEVGSILRDGDMLGRILDTFVAAQLRPELAISRSRPRLYHVRTKNGRQEIDLLAELGGDRVIAIEVKAKAAPDAADARHLAWLYEQLGDRFVAGVVLHTGPRLYQLSEQIVAAPISVLWPDQPRSA